jgi:hypothetical protein
MALVKYNNQSISSVTETAAMASGAMNLITTNTISTGTDTSSFTSSIDSTYDTYIFKFINMHPANDTPNFQVNFRDGSSAFDAPKTTTTVGTQHDEADTSTNLGYESGHDIANGTGYQSLTRNTGNGNDESVSGHLILFSPSSTTFVKHFICETNSYFGNNQTERLFIAGFCDVTAAIDGVDFKFSDGDIDSGVIKMYGLSKS